MPTRTPATIRRISASSTPPPAPTATAPKAKPPQPAPQPPGEGLAIGIGETRATLLWSREAQPDLPAGMGPWRDRLTALHPRYFRLTVDWARIHMRRSDLERYRVT